MCPFLHWGVDSLGAEFFEFPVDSGYQSLVRWVAGKIFSHSVDYLLSLVTVSFAVQKLFSLMHSHLFIVSLKCCAFWVLFRKLFPKPICGSVFPTASWCCFKVSGLILRSLIYFELIWHRVKDRALVSVFCMWISSFPTAFVEEVVFSPLCVLGSFVKDQLAIGAWV
jgi:hypothetical protein